MQYFITAPDGDGQLNLARDEYLLNRISQGEIALYLYVNRNAVIIGRNQNPHVECNLAAMEEGGVQLVRRISGGGAVYHDSGNLNYSFIAHKDIYDEARQTRVIVSALEGFGIKSEVSGRNDMTVNGFKFSGNAFCARGDARQHHGTLLIAANLAVFDRYLTAPRQKLEAKGVKSVRARVCNLSEFNPVLSVEAMSAALKRAFEAEYGEAIKYTEFDRAELDRLCIRHRSREWRLGETPRFDYTLTHKFPWGMAELCFAVEGGRVAKAALFTNSLDISLPERTCALINGCEFDKTALYTALMNGDDMQHDMAKLILEQQI